MLQKLKMFYHRISRHMRPAMAAMAVCAMVMCSAGAVDESSFNLATTMSAAVQTCVNDILSMISAVLPIGVTVLAVSIGVAYGTRFIRKIIKP